MKLTRCHLSAAISAITPLAIERRIPSPPSMSGGRLSRRKYSDN